MLLKSLRQKAFDAYRGLETRHHSLRYLFFEVTRRCNLNCGHCGSDCSRDFRMPELTLDSWKKIVDYLADKFQPLPFIVITGGEPTVRRDLFELTAYLKEKGFRWGMVSNGFDLPLKKYEQAMNTGLESITISLDGLEASHNYLRRHKDSFRRVMETLRIIGTSAVKLADVVTCVHAGNFEELADIAECLIDLNIQRWRLFRIFPKGRAADDARLLMSFEQSRRLVDWIAEHRPAYQRRGLAVSFSCEGYLPFEQDLNVREEPFFCRAGISIASILADGTITGCNNNGPDYYQGNIITDDFATVWNTRFAEYRDKSWLKTGRCRDCREWPHCEGGSIHLRNKGTDGPLFCYVTR